ncbi:MAG TPA: dihydrolipoamide acetyltransferase family protein [Thermoanaerobaculia bacterium]|jgi:pyruvate dehydrogenase E2 component (dihydrolipoamide acetyltransferase)|nr:dihydrolipoamide acetyltransferase family protein [Thermoanaerobaculia bacterium]
MADVIMPKMGDAMTEGKVIRWYKNAGDAVKKGEPLLEIETDKVNLDLEAEQDGTLGDVAAAAGQMVEVGGVLATILAEGEKAAPKTAKPAAAPAKETEKPKPAGEAAAPQESPSRRAIDKKDSIKKSTGDYADAIDMKAPRVDRSAQSANVVAVPHAEGGRRRSSPLARKMARDMGVSLEQIQGSGPGGRIVASDIKNFKPAAAPLQKSKAPSLPPVQQLETKDIPLSAMRRTIAKRLAESTGPIPHFYLTAEYDVTNLLALREQLNEIEGIKTSVNDFIVRAAALALRHHPNVNASWGDDAITQHGEVHIGIAVSTPEGLITPVVRNADEKSVSDIAAEVRSLADKAKNRKLMPAEYQGSTFTISNLGAWGIEQFTAIINPPNVAILAIGAAIAQPVAIDRQVVIRDRMKVTMSCDHRVVDGALGAEYLRTLRAYLEQPLRLII